jgi:hypothetical protein
MPDNPLPSPRTGASQFTFGGIGARWLLETETSGISRKVW